jgi:RNA polymerase sigma factor (TIGR02999 family)
MTVLLHRWQDGDASAFEQIVKAVHADFVRMARSRLSGWDVSLGTGDLVNEAILRLMASPTDWQNRAHFFATVSLTMRSVLREHARARLADKRGGQRVQVTLSAAELGEESMAADLLTLDALLDQLAAHDERLAQVLQLTYFAGLQNAEIAAVLSVSLRTVERDLRFARAWLSERLGRDLEA